MMNLMNKLREKYYDFFSSDEINRKKVRNLLNIKIKSPFDENQVITLGDIIMSMTINEYNIIKTCESYGISIPSEAVDIGDNTALRYLLYHGKNFQYRFVDKDGNIVNKCIDEFNGEKFISDGIPLIPNSHLDKIIHQFKNINESYNSFLGHSFEYNVSDQLKKLGYEVFIPSYSNNPGYDLLVSKEFFEDAGLNFVPYKENPYFGLLQVKTTSGVYNTEHYVDNTLNHFEKYPDIPVIASTRIYNKLSDSIGDDKIISFSDIGINECIAEQQIFDTFINVKEGGLESIIENLKTGLNVSQVDDSVFDSYIPILGIGFKTLVNGQMYYRLFKEGEIEFTDVLKNLKNDATEYLIVGTTIKYSTQKFCEIADVSLAESANSIYESICCGDDIDLEDIEEIAICLVVAAGIGYIAKKAYTMIFGDPKQHLYDLINGRITMLIIASRRIEKNRDMILEYFIPEEYEQNKNEIKSLKEDLEKECNEKIKSLSYFVKEYKIEILEKVILELNKIGEKNKFYVNLIIKLGKLLDICVNESKNLSYVKHIMLKLYDNKSEKIKNTIQKIETLDEMEDLIIKILDIELIRFFEKVKYIGNEELNEIATMLEENNISIQNKIDILRKKGKL